MIRMEELSSKMCIWGQVEGKVCYISGKIKDEGGEY